MRYSHLLLQDQEWRTALHAASYVGGVYIMDLLISSGEIRNFRVCKILHTEVLIWTYSYRHEKQTTLVVLHDWPA